jgi:hypothetical protein
MPSAGLFVPCCSDALRDECEFRAQSNSGLSARQGRMLGSRGSIDATRIVDPWQHLQAGQTHLAVHRGYAGNRPPILVRYRHPGAAHRPLDNR